MRRNYFFAYAAAALSMYALYVVYARQLQPRREVKRKLPNTTKQTIPDAVGNYDIDGVSFDREGVIVGSDDHKHVEV
jgi:hypothetical protein